MHVKPTIIHNLSEAKEAILQNPQIDQCSPPAAVEYAGVLWWRCLIALARAQTGWQGRGFLDCGDNAAWAVEALHAGVHDLMFDPRSPAWADLANLVQMAGGSLLSNIGR